MAGCSLCKKIVQDHRRRKRLNGAGCSVAREVIESLAGVGMHRIPGLRDPGALLCHHCEGSLSSIQSLEAKLAELRQDMKGKLVALLSPAMYHPQAKYRKVKSLNFTIKYGIRAYTYDVISRSNFTMDLCMNTYRLKPWKSELGCPWLQGSAMSNRFLLQNHSNQQ